MTQHINNIPLGNGVVMKEFFLAPGDSAPIPEPRDSPTETDQHADNLINIYHAEDFLEVGGRRIAAIFEGKYSLDDISMSTLEDKFEPSGRFRKAINARRSRVKVPHDGKNVSVRDWNVSGGKIHLIGQSMHYTQFKSTDAVQDQPLHPDDPSFPEGATLRDYVMVNGIESRKGTNVLSNLLGAAFIPRIKGKDGQDYFLLGRRKMNHSQFSSLCVVGGTPMWEEEYFEMDGQADFGPYMKKLGADEHNEELLLKPGEIAVGNEVYLVRTLVRVFDPFYTVDVDPDVTIEDVAQRCFGNESAMEEHDRLYAVPQTQAGLNGLVNNNLGYNIGQGTKAGLHLSLMDD